MAGGRLWTPEEERYLVENYATLGRKACADHLHRSEDGVKDRVKRLGLRINIAWTMDEDELLRKNYPAVGRAGCSILLRGRTSTAIGARAGFLDLTIDRRHESTQYEIEVIRANYRQRGGRKKCVQILPHLAPNVISHIAETLGVLQCTSNNWTEEENQLLRTHYADKGKIWCAQQLPGRVPGSVAVQARNLGLSVSPQSEYFKDWQARAAASKRGRARPGAAEVMKALWKQGRIPQPAMTSERRQKQADTMRAWHARHGNPNKGKILSSEIKQKMSAASRRRWDDPGYRAKMLTAERRERRRQISSANWIRSGRANENAYSRCSGGRRDDLGDMFFRSGWEANYARILNLLIERHEIYRWAFEPDTFKFPVDDRPLSYTPDFKVWELDGSDFYYVELKGWMDDKSRVKLNRMEQFHPGVRLRVVGQSEYKVLQRKFSPLIEKWEFYSSRYMAKQKVA